MFYQKRCSWQAFFALGCVLNVLTTPVAAMPTVSPDFFSTQNAAEDFFEVGRRRLERELKLLEQRHSQRSEKILQIDEQTKLNEKELENEEAVYPPHPLQQRQMN